MQYQISFFLKKLATFPNKTFNIFQKRFYLLAVPLQIPPKKSSVFACFCYQFFVIFQAFSVQQKKPDRIIPIRYDSSRPAAFLFLLEHSTMQVFKDLTPCLCTFGFPYALIDTKFYSKRIFYKNFIHKGTQEKLRYFPHQEPDIPDLK